MRIPFVIAMLALVMACASKMQEIDQLAAQGDWITAIDECAKELAENPKNVEAKSKLYQLRLLAAEHYYHEGAGLLETGRLDEAISQFQQGLIASPGHEKLGKALEHALIKRESRRIYVEAKRNLDAGKSRESLELLTKALDIWPGHPEARTLHGRIQAQLAAPAERDLISGNGALITINFSNTNLKTAFEYISHLVGINVVFDDAVNDVPVTLFAENIPFTQALRLLLATTNTFYKQINHNTILIANDTKDKRAQYDDQRVQVFHLKALGAKDMADILKGVLTLDRLVVNEDINALVIRNTPQMLEQVGSVIALNDRKPAEVLLEVELLEVNRSKAEQLGFDFGSTVILRFSDFTLSDDLADVFLDGVVTVPAITFRYFKQKVDAKILANPRLRSLSRKEAQIHIGDRVPLRTSTILDATGQTRTTFEYKDIGIKLHILPVVHLDNSTTVKLGLEVSALGQNLGTQAEPAYSIGTRNAETIMLLRDGETAVLGGLIREEERKMVISIPGLGDMPGIGNLLSNKDESANRTDVLLTITPRIIRPLDLPLNAQFSFYSGTERNYSTLPIFAEYGPQAPKQPEMLAPALVQASLTDQPSAEDSKPADSGQVVFASPIFEAGRGSDLELPLTLPDMSCSECAFALRFDPRALEYQGIVDEQHVVTNVTAEDGQDLKTVRIGYATPQAGDAEGRSPAHGVRIRFKTLQPGSSTLGLGCGDSGSDDHTECASAAKVIIK